MSKKNEDDTFAHHSKYLENAADKKSKKEKDKLFLQTLMPYMKQIQGREKLKLKKDLIQLVEAYVYPSPIKVEKRKRGSSFLEGSLPFQIKQEPQNLLFPVDAYSAQLKYPGIEKNYVPLPSDIRLPSSTSASIGYTNCLASPPQICSLPLTWTTVGITSAHQPQFRVETESSNLKKKRIEDSETVPRNSNNMILPTNMQLISLASTGLEENRTVSTLPPNIPSLPLASTSIEGNKNISALPSNVPLLPTISTPENRNVSVLPPESLSLASTCAGMEENGNRSASPPQLVAPSSTLTTSQPSPAVKIEPLNLRNKILDTETIEILDD